jgi:Ca2+-binding RTX toxin-like protein
VESLRGGAGADRLRGNGGDGLDLARHSERTAAIAVVLNGLADDGESGEGDNVGPAGDVEDVLGGSGDDVLYGNDSSNRLDGAAGDDLLDGADAADVLIGAAGFDVASYLFRVESVVAAIDAMGRRRSGAP